MDGIEEWRLDLDGVVDNLALGLDLFGPYAEWLLYIPAFWAAAVLMIWTLTSWQRRQSDRAYLDYASRQLPILRRIAKQRAQEVGYSRRSDRF